MSFEIINYIELIQLKCKCSFEENHPLQQSEHVIEQCYTEITSVLLEILTLSMKPGSLKKKRKY